MCCVSPVCLWQEAVHTKCMSKTEKEQLRTIQEVRRCREGKKHRWMRWSSDEEGKTGAQKQRAGASFTRWIP